MREMQNTSRYRTLISRTLQIFYPSSCPLCEKTSDTVYHAPLCTSCWHTIKRYTGPSCRICAMPFSSSHSSLCGKCLKMPPPFSKVLTYGLFEGALVEAIHQFKFHGIKRLSGPLSELLLTIDIPEADGCIPVPLSIQGLRERGFNQSLLLARNIARRKKLPLFMDVLHKLKETPPQLGLSASKRLSNLKGAFQAKRSVQEKRLLLVDDVITTGATVAECAKQLLKAGARKVVVLSIARSSMM